MLFNIKFAKERELRKRIYDITKESEAHTRVLNQMSNIHNSIIEKSPKPIFFNSALTLLHEEKKMIINELDRRKKEKYDLSKKNIDSK